MRDNAWKWPRAMQLRLFSATTRRNAASAFAAAFLLAVAPAALAQEAPKIVTAPVPPARPFDLQLPGGGTDAGLPGVAAPVAAPAQPDPPPRAAPNAPVPPPRPDVAPVSKPEDEEEEPAAEWPRRTPGQRNLDFEPRVPPADEVLVNGVSSDPGTSTRCLPSPLKRVLDQLVKQYGSVRVTSTFRPVWRARRNSYHRRCEAMDIRVPGQSPRAVLAFVKTLAETGGHKVYWNGLVHVDIGPWRTW
ncbi:MAG: D-Ala-D-Ala carboxypeptidase family metallohydrolase [Hyphomicrobiales bacterium]|nr:D-Ala-D-Ala carboxypeptidase family metallohydrolase [Hyphomicrobiales bacterium]